jgi:hypothetical protein
MERNYKKLLTIYIKNEIENLILYIHKIYPKIIQKSDVKYLLKKYSKNNNYSYKKYKDKDKNKIYFKVKQKIFIRKFKNKNISITTKERLTNFAFNKDKCNARIWGNGIIITLEDGRVIYGKQCGRKKCDNKYCTQHNHNNPHDDFNKEPSDKLKQHYQKYQKKLDV